MHRIRFPFAALALGALVPLWPARAVACTPPELPVLPGKVLSAPLNGAVVFRGSHSPTQLASALQVIDSETGAMVEGEIVHEGWVAWGATLIAFRPDAPLIEGRLYEATLGEETFMFAAEPAATWSIEDLEVTASLESVQYPHDLISCARAMDVTACAGAPIIPVSLQTSFELRPQVDLSDVEQATHQLVLSFNAWVQNERPLTGMYGDFMPLEQASMTFERASEAYCYRVTLRSLVDDSEATHEGCVDGITGEAGVVPLLITPVSEDEVAIGIDRCRDHLGAELATFCAKKRETCSIAECVVLEQLCEGAERPVELRSGEDVQAMTMPDAGQSMPEPANEQLSALKTPDDEVIPSSCSALPGQRGGAGFMALLGLCVSLLRRARSNRD